MVYKIFYWKDNPTFEYRFKNKEWQKRKKGSNEQWYRIAESSQNLLTDKYKPKSNLRPFWNISATTKLAVGIIVLGVGYYIYKGNINSNVNGLR